MIEQDHIMIIDSDVKSKINRKRPRRVYLFHKADWDKIRNEISSLQQRFYEALLSEKTVESNWSSFLKGIQCIMQDHIPSNMTRGKFDPPWMTQDAKHLHRRKQRAYHSPQNL